MTASRSELGTQLEPIWRVLGRAKDSWHDAALAALRTYTGLVIFVAHAWPKLAELVNGRGHFPELVAEMGFPAPMLFAWLATLSQVVGTLLLLAGAATRLGALMVLSTLTVGIVGVHFGDPFPVVEAGLLYLVVLGLFVVVGGGRYSLDRWVLSSQRQAER